MPEPNPNLLKDAPFPEIRASLERIIPFSALSSTLFRLCFAFLITPLLAWWLIGFTYIPFLSLDSTTNFNTRTAKFEQSGDTLCGDTPHADKGQKGSIFEVKEARVDASKSIEINTEEHVNDPLPPPVVLKIPKCSFLLQARKKYGIEKAQSQR